MDVTIPIFIEDQPDIEGWGGKWPIAPETTEGISGDFGNTHSLALVVDSLAVMNTFMGIDPTLSKAAVETILSGASNQRGVGFYGTQGVADGNSLEESLDALRKVFLPNASKTNFNRASGGYGDVNNRNAFYSHIAELDPWISGGAYTISPMQDANVQAFAKQQSDTGVAYRYALRELNPFVVVGVNYAAIHNADRSLDYAATDANADGMTDQYIADRSALLDRKLFFGAANLNNDYTNPTNATLSASPLFSGKNPYLYGPYFEDRASGYKVLQGGSLGVAKASKSQFIFGGATDDTDLIGGALADHIYGMAGVDTIVGNAGNDYLEGNAGADTLNGGDGNDKLLGGADADSLLGDAGDDKLYGGQGADLLDGGTGRDELYGGTEGDVLRGGAGVDTARWRRRQ